MIKKIGLITCILCLVIGCSDESGGPVLNYFSGKDRRSPTLTNIQAINETTIEFTFDEDVYRPQISLQDGFSESTCSVYENKVSVYLSHPLNVMLAINVHVSVRDNMGNTTTIEAPVYGINFSVPSLIINEFSTKGSANHPDRVEIKALSSGNLAGVTLYSGMFFSHTHSFSFPSIEVEKGDYIVVQYQKVPPFQENLLYYGGEEGLGGNNGVISLYNSPYEDIADVVIYSNRTSDSDEHYGGFGTRKVYEHIQEVTLTQEWIHNGIIRPESAINSDDSTATRSYNRYEDKEDTNSSLDWYIVQTSGSSFLEENNTEEYAN
jgi:hypothetical protein